MFIRGIDRPNKKKRNFYVIESYREGEAQTPRHRVIVSLGHSRSVERAYGEAMRDYLKAAQRLQAFEAVLPHLSGKAQHGA